jgi:AraC-like DNA-binding protein
MLFIDIIINFKKPTDLKIVLILIPIVLMIRGFGYIYLFHYEYNRWLIEMPLSINAALSLIFVSYLYYNKFHWFYVGFSILFILIGFGFQIHYTYRNIEPNIPLIEVSKELKLIKGIFSVFAFFLFLQLFYKIISAFKPNNKFTIDFKKWLTLLFAVFILNFSMLFTYQILKIKFEVLVLIINIIIAILLYYRPRFFNVLNLKIVNNISFEKKLILNVSDQLFNTVFFAEKYYLNNEANVGQFCDKLNINPEILKDYTNTNYHMTFIDLINKNRVEYFVDLIKSGKYNNYTIEALSQLAGFGSRIHLYNNFKKFHGGKPSDLMKIIKA